MSELGTNRTLHSGAIQATSKPIRMCGQKQKLHLRKSRISLQEAQLQENPWQESLISLWMIFLEQVETKWNNVCYPDLERISKVVQKIGMMWPSQDKESLDEGSSSRIVH